MLWGVVNFGLFVVQQLCFPVIRGSDVSIAKYHDFITYNKGELPIVFLEKYNAIVFSYRDVKAFDDPEADQPLKYLCNRRGLSLIVKDKFFKILFRDIDPNTLKCFIVRNTTTIKGYVVLQLSYMECEEDFKVALGTLIEDTKNERLQYAVECNHEMVELPGKIVGTRDQLEMRYPRKSQKNNSSFITLVKSSNMLSNPSSNVADLGELLGLLNSGVLKLVGGESVHLLEKAFSSVELKGDTFIIQCVIDYFYIKVNNVLLHITQWYETTKKLNSQRIELYNLEDITDALEQIELILFILGVFLLMYWGSPSLRLHLALSFVCFLLGGIMCFD